MKKMLTLVLAALLLTSSALCANTPGTTNLWQGIFSLDATVGDNWQNTSLVFVLPGNTRLENASATTLRIQVGFSTIPTGGATWDVAHAKLYTTLRGSNKITAVQDLKEATLTAPYSVNLATACTVAVTVQNPCFFTFDTSTITTNIAHDYYIILANSNTVNNQSVKFIKAQNGFVTSPVITFFVAGDATTGLIVGSVVPIVQNLNRWGLASVTF